MCRMKYIVGYNVFTCYLVISEGRLVFSISPFKVIYVISITYQDTRRRRINKSTKIWYRMMQVAHIRDVLKSFEKNYTTLFVEDMQILCNQYIMRALIKTITKKTNLHVTLHTPHFDDMMCKEY